MSIMVWAVLIGVAGSLATPGGQLASRRGTVVFPDGTKVSVEIADSPETRERGLMFRRQLGPNEGMVFVWSEPGFYPFWMKNTLIPLDIIWLDAGGRVVSIAASVPPCRADPCPTYPPAGSASCVVEVAAGFTAAHGVKPGDTLTLVEIPRKGR